MHHKQVPTPLGPSIREDPNRYYAICCIASPSSRHQYFPATYIHTHLKVT